VSPPPHFQAELLQLGHQLYLFAGIGKKTHGGVQAWEAEGLPLNRGRKMMSLERQVRIAAGALVFTGALLGYFVNPAWIALSGFVGAGLVFAGITDTCGIGMLMARMPWRLFVFCNAGRTRVKGIRVGKANYAGEGRRRKVCGISEGLSGGFPVQRGEVGDVVDWPGRELRQDVVEVFAQINLEAFAGLHDGEDGCDFGTGSFAADVQPVFATERQGTHRVLYAEMVIMPRSLRRSCIFQQSD